MAFSYTWYRIKAISLFTTGSERTLHVKKSILFSLIIKSVSILTNLALVPITINYINATKYGIWLTLSSIIGWVSFFDIGFGNGLRNKFAEASALNKTKEARVYVSTTYFILSLVLLVAIAIFALINPYINWAIILNTPFSMNDELTAVAFVIFTFFCLQLLFRLITTILTADQKPAKASLLVLLGNVVSLAIIFVLTKTTSGNLYYLAFALSFSPVLIFITSSIWFYKTRYKCYTPTLKFVKFSYAGELFSLGFKFFIIQIAALIIYQTDNIIIAQIFGPSAVTPFNIGFKYFGVASMVFNIVLSPLWSAYTDAYVKNDTKWIKNAMKKIVIVWFTLVFAVTIMLLFSRKAYELWVGSSINIPFLLSLSLAFYAVINSWCSIFSFFLNGVGKIKMQLYSAILGAVFNIPLSYYLATKMGVSGVILATCLLGLVSAIWSPIQYYKVITNKAQGIWNK